MKIKKSLIAVFICALLLTLLFYKQGIGLNVLLFEILFFVWLFVTKQIPSKNRVLVVTSVATIFTAFCTVFVYTVYSYFIHFLALFTFIGALNYPKARSIVTAYLGAWANTFMSVITFFKQLFNPSNDTLIAKTSTNKWLKYIIPTGIIIGFIFIYSNANADFGAIVSSVLGPVGDAIHSFFKGLNFGVVFTYIFFFFVSIFLIIRYANLQLAHQDVKANNQLLRVREKAVSGFKNMGLKNELRTGVFLLIVLNILLLLLNLLDLKNVWFGFEWNGETLKEFVHEGTYLLILSILISIALVLYYFRKNLNFYSNNGLLKKLSYIWIAQNAFLALSVGMRNYWYIEYYALAYKKIGVLFFLAATIYGLYTVFIKVRDKKSSFYLFRKNAMCVFLILVFTSAVPWDILIAKYNYQHADASYLELDYLAGFSDKSLPYLDKPLAEISSLKANQNVKFLPDSDVEAAEFVRRINYKKVAFKEKWEGKNWLSWNWAEYRAYCKLFTTISK